MPYSPGQPWDNTLSYTTGQTCTYNGFPYVWYHPVLASTPGAKPNEEEVLFTAVLPGGFNDQRLERGWVLADESNVPSGGTVYARFGDVKRLQRSIRGIDPEADKFNEQPEFKYEWGIYPSWWQKNDNVWIPSWSFYGFDAMSVDYGLENNAASPPVPPTNGNPNVNALLATELSTILGPLANEPSLPSTDFISLGEDSGEIKVYYTIDETYLYAPTFINEFDRIAYYTLVIKPDYDTPAYEINGSISSGPFRDGFSLESTSNVNTHSVTTGPGFYYQFKVNSLSPRFDN